MVINGKWKLIASARNVQVIIIASQMAIVDVMANAHVNLDTLVPIVHVSKRSVSMGAQLIAKESATVIPPNLPVIFASVNGVQMTAAVTESHAAVMVNAIVSLDILEKIAQSNIALEIALMQVKLQEPVIIQVS